MLSQRAPGCQRVAIQCNGSRGDVQPYLCLALSLQQADYEVSMITVPNLIPLVEEAGGLEAEGKPPIKAYKVFLDGEAEMKKGKPAEAKATGDETAFLKAMGEVGVKYAKDVLQKWKDAIEEIKPDLVISGTLCEYYAAIAERHLKIPVVMVLLSALPRDPDRMIWGLPHLPCGMTRWLMKTVMGQVHKVSVANLDPHCQELYGVKVFQELYLQEDLEESFFTPRYGLLIAMCKAEGQVLDPRAHPNVKYCGFLAMEQEDQEKQVTVAAKNSGLFGSMDTEEAIKDFISKGEKPVFMGWGSMMAKSPEHMAQLVAQSARHAKVRAIVYKGWANMSQETLRKATGDQNLIDYAEKNVLFVGKSAHEALFPQCAAIVHHGGAGTTQTATRAGTPQIITPILLDQWDRARFVNLYGSGLGFEKKNLSKLSFEELSDAISKCMNDQGEMKSKACKLREEMKGENAALFIREHMEWFWREKVQSGEYKKHIEARLEEIKERKASKCCRS